MTGSQLAEFLHHGNTQVRQIGIVLPKEEEEQKEQEEENIDPEQNLTFRTLF